MRVIEYRATEADDGRQIKHVLGKALRVSRRQLTRLKHCDGMCVNGASVHANFIIHAGDLISISLEKLAEPEGEGVGEAGGAPELPQAEAPQEPTARLNASECARMDEEFAAEIARLSPGGEARTQAALAEEIVLFEDDDLLVVNKPAPLPTSASARQRGLTLESVLYARYGAGGDWNFRPVNRLDRGTSGLMALAKTAHAHYALQRQLHTPDYARVYEAIVVGRPEPLSGEVNLPIGRADDSIVKREVRADGKPSRTRYCTLFTNGARSAVALLLYTGRTHQIRVHMSAIGCPVAGDFLYGEELAELPGRFALHSSLLCFTQPVTGERMCFYAPLPADMRRLLPGHCPSRDGLVSAFKEGLDFDG